MLFLQKYRSLHKGSFLRRVFRGIPYYFYFGLALTIISVVTLTSNSIYVAAQTSAPTITQQEATSPRTATPPNTKARCKINAYIMRLNDFNFAERSFFLDSWLYANCSKPNNFSFQSVYFPNAKNYNLTYTSSEQVGEGSYVSANLQGNFEKSWNLRNYPFDRHTLQLFFEPSENLDVNKLIYEGDMTFSKIHPGISLEDGWKINSFKVTGESSHYISNFGDPRIKTSDFNFPKLMITFEIQRNSYMSFIKLTAGVYAAVTLSFLALLLDEDFGDRLGIFVGTLFAVLVNMQVATSNLGSTNSITMIDSIHIIAILYIFVTAVLLVYTRFLSESDQAKTSRRLMRRIAVPILSSSFVVFNIVVIVYAAILG